VHGKVVVARLRDQKLDPKDPASLAQLLTELEPLAAKWLAKNKEFAPFGAAISAGGEVVTMMSGESDGDSKQQLSTLVRTLAESQWEAGILLVNVRVAPPGGTTETDAIWIITENRSGFARQVDMPYAMQGGNVIWGTPFRTHGEQRIIYPAP
jgi:hypothetical protein